MASKLICADEVSLAFDAVAASHHSGLAAAVVVVFVVVVENFGLIGKFFALPGATQLPPPL